MLIEFLGFPSPVPTHTTLGLLCCIATAPIFKIGCSSKTGVQLTPLLFVFQTPPDAAPIQILFGFATSTSMEVTRPLIEAGPTLRGFQFLNTLLMSTFGVDAATTGAAFFDFCADTDVVNITLANTMLPKIDIRIVINLLI